jgi:hypothetical protein
MLENGMTLKESDLTWTLGPERRTRGAEEVGGGTFRFPVQVLSHDILEI